MELEATRQRLLKNAEKLMAEKGISATSVREITDASEANVASVNYYFGSKAELLLELLKSRFMQLDAALLERVITVERAASGQSPDLPELTGAYFDALVDLGFNSASGQLDTFILLIQRAAAEQEAVLERAQDYTAPGISRLIDLLSMSIPTNRRVLLDVPVLVDLMFGASITAISVMGAQNKNDLLIAAIRDFLVAGVEAYLVRIAGGT